MASLSEIWIKKETVELLYKAFQKNTEINGIGITISLNDESNEWGQNVSAYLSQTKEEREEKKKKFYVGNGKTFWTDGKITLGAKKEDKVEVAEVIDDKDDLPF